MLHSVRLPSLIPPSFFMNKRVSSVIGWTCAILVAAFNLFAAVMKFVPMAPGSEGAMFMEKLGVTPGLEHVLGVLELVIVILFLIPLTSTVGFVLMVGYLGGALATNLTHNLGIMDVLPLYIMFILLMISAWFRNPELINRLLKRPVQA
ncbi:MAG: DoxX family protein [Candidatus Peribacteria bacterium]|nr:DoxX family protein [Candidatus Peribacteria bacterium]